MSHFRFVKRDLGKGRRAKGDGDCTVRAFALAAGLSYDVAWQFLYEAQNRHRTTCFRVELFFERDAEIFGVSRRLSFPAETGVPRMNAVQFAQRYPHGSYVLSMAHHVAAMEDGTLYDSWDSSRRCVYAAWEIDGSAFRERNSLEVRREIEGILRAITKAERFGKAEEYTRAREAIKALQVAMEASA